MINRPPANKVRRGTTTMLLVIVLLVQSSISACATYREKLTKRMPIISNPPGAMVFLNDAELGTTPLNLEVDYYRLYEVKNASGYVAWGILFLPIAVLVGIIGSLSEGDIGLLPVPFTPYSVLKMQNKWSESFEGFEGKHLSLRTEKDGFIVSEKQLDTYMDNEVTFLLTGSIPARVSVESVPPGATVFLDDQRVGRTPLRKNLAINYIDGRRIPVRIRAELAGYSSSPLRGFIEQTDTDLRIIFVKSSTDTRR